jgi:hypothetical protein
MAYNRLQILHFASIWAKNEANASTSGQERTPRFRMWKDVTSRYVAADDHGNKTHGWSLWQFNRHAP